MPEHLKGQLEKIRKREERLRQDLAAVTAAKTDIEVESELAKNADYKRLSHELTVLRDKLHWQVRKPISAKKHGARVQEAKLAEVKKAIAHLEREEAALLAQEARIQQEINDLRDAIAKKRKR